MFVIVLTELETLIIACLYQTNTRQMDIVIRYFYTILLIILSMCALAFSIVKLVFVLQKHTLNLLYLSSVYLFLIFSSIELISILLMIPYLKRIKLLEQEQENAKKRKVDLKRLFTLTKSVRLIIGVASIFLFIASATQIVQPYYFGKIVDDALSADSMHSINVSVLTLLAINLVGAIASFFRSWFFELSGQ